MLDRRYMAGILPIRRKTPKKSINQHVGTAIQTGSYLDLPRKFIQVISGLPL